MSERFPDIDWWCDRCGAYLNDQDGFDDHHYIWKCTECGHAASCYSQGNETLAMGGHDYSTDSVDYIDVYEE